MRHTLTHTKMTKIIHIKIPWLLIFWFFSPHVFTLYLHIWLLFQSLRNSAKLSPSRNENVDFLLNWILLCVWSNHLSRLNKIGLNGMGLGSLLYFVCIGWVQVDIPRGELKSSVTSRLSWLKTTQEQSVTVARKILGSLSRICQECEGDTAVLQWHHAALQWCYYIAIHT